MAERTKYNNSLKKEIFGFKVYLWKGWDLIHGYGWFSQSYCSNTFEVGFGFSKSSRFSAVRNSINNLKENKVGKPILRCI